MKNNPLAVSAVRTSNRLAYDQVGEQEALEFAIVRFNPVHPHLEECNFACEVIENETARSGAPAESERGADDAHCAAVIEQIERYFVSRGLTCSRWLPAAGAFSEGMERALARRGYVRQAEIAMLGRSDVSAAMDGRIRVVSGRAMRRGLTAVLKERAAGRPDEADEWVDVALGRLDDPQYDSYLALRGDRPVGMAALHQAGEIGRLRDVYVLREERRTGVASALVHYVVATARRWSLRPICAEVDERNVAGRALFAKAGFEEAGRLTAFRAPAARGWIW